MSDFTPPMRKKIALDNSKLGLMTKCPSAEGKMSKLVWGLNKNNPFLRVYTGDPADESDRTKGGRIQAELDAPHLFMLLELIRQAVKAESGWKTSMSCDNYVFPGGKRSEKPVNVADVWVGKDKDGVVYLSVVDKILKDRPVIKFDVALPDYWIHVRHADGRTYSKAEGSVVFAQGYANMLEKLYSTLLVDEFVPYAPPVKPGGGGGGYNRGGQGGGGAGGGYNRGNQGGGGGSAPAPDAGPDGDGMPF